jgi:hypothetical protein
MAGIRNNILDLPLLPIVFLFGSGLETCGEFLHHGHIIASIVAGDVANLQVEGKNEQYARFKVTDTFTLCAIPIRIIILNRACLSRLPL